MQTSLTITSPTNSHALANYMALSVLGGYFTFTVPPEWLVSEFGSDLSVAMGGALMFLGAVALTATIMGSRRRDPSAALSLEIGSLLLLVPITFTFFMALINFYGYTAPSSIVFAGAYCAGCTSRVLQGGNELHVLNRVRRQVKRRAAGLTAAPEKE